MKRFLRWFIAVGSVLLLLALIGLLSRDLFLKGLAQRRIQQRTGLRAEIGVFRTSLTSPNLLLRDLKLYNRPDFGGGLLLEVPECFIELDSFQVGETLHFKEIRLHLAQLNIIRDKQGRFNLKQAEQEYHERAPASAKTNAPRAKLQFTGIDRLLLTVGKVKFTDLQKPSRNREIEVGLKDELVTHIKNENDLREWVGGTLFGLILQELWSWDKKGKGSNVQIFWDPLPEEGATNNPEKLPKLSP